MFSWKPSDAPGVLREVIERHFAAHHGARPIQRKIRRQALEKQDFIRMPFELANTGPTFQRTMRISLQDLQSHNVEAYHCCRKPAAGNLPTRSVGSLQQPAHHLMMVMQQHYQHLSESGDLALRRLPNNTSF